MFFAAFAGAIDHPFADIVGRAYQIGSELSLAGNAAQGGEKELAQHGKLGNALARLKPRAIILLSCDPPMLARDIKELLKSGYKLERVTPFDMFPQTAHCEAVAELMLA